MVRVPIYKFVLTSVLLAACVSGFGAQNAEQSRSGKSSSNLPATIALGELPEQGRSTYRLIFQGGPFTYDKDGVVFGNRERQLPGMKRGFYHEYTVKTPGSRDRGARRIVCGGPVRTPEVCYYTADHYASFRQIVE